MKHNLSWESTRKSSSPIRERLYLAHLARKSNRSSKPKHGEPELLRRRSTLALHPGYVLSWRQKRGVLSSEHRLLFICMMMVYSALFCFSLFLECINGIIELIIYFASATNTR